MALETDPEEHAPYFRREELRAIAAELSPLARLSLVHQALQGGDFDGAYWLCESKSNSDSAWLILKAKALHGRGKRELAHQLLNSLTPHAGVYFSALFTSAELLASEGQFSAARAPLLELARDAPDYPGALALLAKLTFPGPHYRQVLNCLHQHLKPATYLEIGVEAGQSLRLAKYSSRVVGVDPAPQLPDMGLPHYYEIFRQTSAEFFEFNQQRPVLDDGCVDMAFVDGMHSFDRVLRDFANVEQLCHPQSCIVLHDCLPVAPAAAKRQRSTRFWVGDCCQALDCLLAERPDLEITVVPCSPSGLIVIRNLDPNKTSFRTVLPELIRSRLQTPGGTAYPYQSADWQSLYPLIENSTQALTNLLDPD